MVDLVRWAVRAEPQRPFPPPFAWYSVVLLALAAISLADTGIGLLLHRPTALEYLWQPWPASDYYDYLPRFAVLHSPSFFTVYAYPWVYPAPAAFILYPFYQFSRPTHWHPGYFLFAGSVLGLSFAFAWRLRQKLIEQRIKPWHATALLGLTFCPGWPLYFALERGNIEALLWIGIATGVFCAATGRHTRAAGLIGVFGSAKLYPLFFLGLLFRKGRYRSFALGVALWVLTTLAGLRFLEPDVRDAWHQVSVGVQTWTAMMTLCYWPGGIGPDHSLFGLLRQVSFGGVLRLPNVLPLVLGLAGTTALLIFLLRVRRFPLSNQVLFLACAAILLPPASFDYTLVYLLIPWGMLVLRCAEQREQREVQQFNLPFLLLGVAMAPLTFLHTYGTVPLYFEGPMRSVALLCLAGIAAWRPLPGPAGEGNGSEGAGLGKDEDGARAGRRAEIAALQIS